MDLEGEPPIPEEIPLHRTPSRQSPPHDESGYFGFSQRSTLLMAIGCAVIVVGIAWTAFAVLIKVAISAYESE